MISEGKAVRARFIQSGEREEKAFHKDKGEDAKGGFLLCQWWCWVLTMQDYTWWWKKHLWTLHPIEINRMDSLLEDIVVTMEKKCKKDDLRLPQWG